MPNLNCPPREISNVNPEITSFPIPKTKVIRWKSTDGKKIKGLLTYPMNYEAGNNYPFILNIHCGP
jgi:dipeptidyl aminopeptidase/acylaminoacyl peptidase